MAVHSPLNAFSFDISLIEIGQEIKLLEHLKKKLDHPVYENYLIVCLSNCHSLATFNIVICRMLSRNSFLSAN
jgi:hypothetical protein